MDIEKATYGTIIKFGDMQDLKTKLQIEGKSFEEIIDFTDEDGISLLEHCLISRKFDLAKEFLSHNAKVNVVSPEGYNEFHYIASNINCDGALDIAKILLDRGTSLTAIDKKYGNQAIFTLCMEIFKKRSDEGMSFLETCLKSIDEYDTCNKAGYSIRMIINERGSEELKKILE